MAKMKKSNLSDSIRDQMNTMNKLAAEGTNLPQFKHSDSNMVVAYIAHPVSGDMAFTVDDNMKDIVRIVREINLNEPHVVPFVPYYIDLLALDDSDKNARARGIKNDHYLLTRRFINEMRLYGHKISGGMREEIILAHENFIFVRPMTNELTKEYNYMLEELNLPLQPRNQTY